MNGETPTTEARLRAMLENIRTATANSQAMDSPGDDEWVQDGESDAEYLRSIQRDTIARLNATARDIEACWPSVWAARPGTRQRPRRAGCGGDWMRVRRAGS